nr:MAG TPA: hypothetical protein [Caudoviricetes sp.]
MELKLLERLKEAYETSSRNFNNFKEAIESVKWEHKFKADGEYYFIIGKLTITVENLDPFEEKWKPTAIFNDGYVVEF